MSTNGKSIPPLSEADQRRFWAKVKLPDERGCMEWTASKIRSGYGRFGVGGVLYYAHRISYTLANGQIPAGLVLDHLCRNRACVNPQHLEVVSQRENILRGEAPRVVGQRNREKTHCPAGHAYDEANTYRRPPSKAHPNGGRDCLTCRRERARAYSRRKRPADGAANS